jgi:tetratricopeptide (TPR) repeat protein
MEKEPGTALDYDLARELAIREGLKAVIGGEVMSVGASYLVSARLVAAELGDVLWTDSETAGDSAAIIPALDRLSRRLRERVGESLKTIRPNEPLAAVTTSSLQALKKYSQASLAQRLEGDQARAIALLEEAIALDTMFAAAYGRLGSVLSDNAQDRQRAVQAFTRAHELRHHVTELERYRFEAAYYYHVTREFHKSATTLRTLLDTYENWGARNLLANTYWWLGEYALAEPLYRQNLVEDTLSAWAHNNLLITLVAQGKFDEADATLELMARRLPSHPLYRRAGFGLAMATGDYETAEAHVKALRQAEGADLLWRAATSRMLANMARLRGELAEYERYRRDAMAANGRRGLPAQYVLDAISLGATDAWFHGPSDRAERIVEDALDRYPLESMEPLDRPYMNLAFFYAVSGNTERARVPLAEFEAEIDPVLRADQEPSRHLQLSLIALAEGHTAQAIEEARIALESTSPLSELPALFRIGWAYDNAGEADSAVAYYEQWLGTPHYGQIRSLELPKVCERLGDLYEQRSDTAKAIYHYSKFVDLWKDADPELQPRVEAARRAIEALSPDT